MKNPDRFWFWSLVLIVIGFWFPTRDVFLSLSPGDTGRDLYAFWMTFQGKRVCQDFWWQYGPLMPLYYAFLFLIGGVNLLTVKLGLGVIYLLCSILTYRTLRLFTSAPVAFLGGLAFLGFDMTWTFNHIGAFPFLLFSIYALLKFFLTREFRWCTGASLSLAGVALVKISAGAAFFGAFFASFLLFYGFFRSKRNHTPSVGRRLIFICLLFGGTVLGAYALYYQSFSLPRWVQRCWSVGAQYNATGNTPWINFQHLIQLFFIWDRRRLYGLSVLTALAVADYFVLRRRGTAETQKLFPVILGSLLFFALASTFDYILMEGLSYRLGFWAFPILILLAGFLGEWTSAVLPRPARILLGGLAFFALMALPVGNLREALALRIPERYLRVPSGRVYLGGPVSYPSVLNQGAQFIRDQTKPEEEILTVPYDVLYCFLAGRRHATRETMFLEHVPLPEKRQEAIRGYLEEKRVPYVIFSNRYRSTEKGIGHFGKTHCRKLADYLSSHYEEVRTFGPWEEDPLKVHGIKVLAKKGLSQL